MEINIFGQKGRGESASFVPRNYLEKFFLLPKNFFCCRARKFFFSGSIPNTSFGALFVKKEGCIRVYLALFKCLVYLCRCLGVGGCATFQASVLYDNRNRLI